MFQLDTDIIINAPAEDVWRVVMDFAAYVEWNPFVRAIEGDPVVGERLQVTLQQKDSKPMVIRPRVVEAGERRFGWLGRFLVPRLFDGEHWFSVESIGDNQTRFRQWENFRGLLVSFLRGMLENKTKPAFEAMNRALKARVEERTVKRTRRGRS